MNKQQRNNLQPVIFIVSIALIIRFVFNFFHPNVYIDVDMLGYYKTGKRIISEKIIFDHERTPVYPLVIMSSLFTTGNMDTELYSKEFFNSMLVITIFQQAIGILSLIFLYYTLLLMGIKVAYSFLYTLFITFNIFLLSFERVILTESLTTSWLILIMFLVINIFQNPRKIYFLFLTLAFIFGFLLKPVYFAFPLVILSLIILYHKKKQVFLLSTVSAVGFFSILIFYINQNYINYNFLGINHVGDINILGKILQFNLPIENAKDIKYYYETVSDYRSRKGGSMPYIFLDYYDPTIYNNIEKLSLLSKFTRKVILSNPWQYITKSLLQIPGAMLDVNQITLDMTKSGAFLTSPFYFLLILFNYLQYITLLALVVYPITLIKFLIKPTIKYAFLILIGTISIYQIFFSVFLSYGEFDRLISVAQPQLFLFSFYWWGKIIKFVIRNIKLLLNL